MSQDYTPAILVLLEKRSPGKFNELAKLIHQYGKPGKLSIPQLAKKLEEWVRELRERLRIDDDSQIASMISEKYF